MKGVESIGFSLLLSVLVFVIILPLFFSFYDDFNKLKELNVFKNGLESLYSEFDLLKTTGEGSFSRISIIIPSNYVLTLVNGSVSIFNGVETNDVGVDLLFKEDYSFKQGEYELVLCYGFCDLIDKYLIIFN